MNNTSTTPHITPSAAAMIEADYAAHLARIERIEARERAEQVVWDRYFAALVELLNLCVEDSEMLCHNIASDVVKGFAPLANERAIMLAVEAAQAEDASGADIANDLRDAGLLFDFVG